MKPKDSSYNWKRNFSNKHLTRLKPKDATMNPTKIKSLQQKLRNHDNLAAVPTNKTNSFRTAS